MQSIWFKKKKALWSFGQKRVSFLSKMHAKNLLNVIIFHENEFEGTRSGCSLYTARIPYLSPPTYFRPHSHRPTTNPNPSKFAQKFGNSEKCARCGESVYAAEKVVGAGKVSAQLCVCVCVCVFMYFSFNPSSNLCTHIKTRHQHFLPRDDLTSSSAVWSCF